MANTQMPQQPPYMPPPPMMPGPTRTSGLAIAGFVCAFFCSLLGLILSILGLNEVKRSNGQVGGRGLALAGIIISAISIGASIVIAVVFLFVAKKGFDDYKTHSKKPEASLQLNKLMKSSKVAYITNAEFIKGEAPLTPAKSCCGQPNDRCAVDTNAWTSSPVWQALDFQIDEPNLFQYSYKSDGKTVEATAVGDLDCDGTFITYTMHMDALNGNPSGLLTEPPPNAD